MQFATSPVQYMTTQVDGVKNELLNVNVIQDLIAQIGRPNLDIVVAKMERDVAVLWEKLLCASRDADSQRAEQHAHTLASLFRTMGLLPVGDSLAEIEMKLRGGEKLDPGWPDQLELSKRQSLEALQGHIRRDLQLQGA